jgi:hypothetical protein
MRRAVLSLFLALLCAHAPAAETPRFEVDPFWPRPLPNNWQIGQVAGVAVDAQDHVWIIQRPRSLTNDEKGASLDPPRSRCCIPAPPVIEFDAAGNVVRAWGGAGQGYEWPSSEHGIRIDPKGNVWLGGTGNEDGMLLKFTREGKFLMQIGHAGPRKGNNDTTQLGRPADTWFDAAANEVYVADGYGNHRIIVFDSDTGAYKRHWGAYGKRPVDEPSQEALSYDPARPPSQSFNNPVHCVKIADDDLVYVCDRSNDRIQVFRKDGSFVREWVQMKDTRGSGSIWDLYVWPDKEQSHLVVVDGENNEARVMRRSDGEVVTTFGRNGRNAGQFHWVHNIAIDSKGNVFTSEVDTGKRVQKFRPLGAPPQR